MIQIISPEKLALTLSLEMLDLPLSPEMSPFHCFCSQITALIAIGDLATGLHEPCIYICIYIYHIGSRNGNQWSEMSVLWS